jgi:NO-binding membrane sensor protein with MHYT domain/GGDEF domain-containing protein
MNAGYDLTLVGVSYLIAILASYCALYFGTQLTSVSGGKRRVWLVLGAISMGMGIWSMHFTGMGAYKMGMPMSYDLSMTVISAIAAVLSSGLALFLISHQGVGLLTLASGSLVMGGGIGLMHYLGMAAMKMTPAVSYDPVWFSVSIAIAVGASAAALAICRFIQTVRGRRAAWLQIAAALVMGAAVCGMHYSGMEAVVVPAGSMPAMDNELSGMALGIPVVLVTVVFSLIAMLTVYADVTERLAEEERMRQEEEWVKTKAFIDESTGLPNRSGIERFMLNALVGGPGVASPFTVLMLEIANARDLNSEQTGWAQQHMMKQLGDIIRAIAPENAYVGRYSHSTFAVVLHDTQALDDSALLTLVRSHAADRGIREIRWKTGRSQFPQNAQSSQMLLKEALKTQIAA